MNGAGIDGRITASNTRLGEKCLPIVTLWVKTVQFNIGNKSVNENMGLLKILADRRPTNNFHWNYLGLLRHNI